LCIVTSDSNHPVNSLSDTEVNPPLSPRHIQLQVHQQTATILLSKAVLFADSGNLLRAEACCTQALLRTPKNADALTLMARIKHLGNSTAQAVELLVKALQNDNNHGFAGHQLITLLEVSQLDDATGKTLQFLLTEVDLPAILLTKIAQLLFEKSRYALALPGFAILQKIEPSVLQHRLHHADCLNMLGRFEEAEQQYCAYLAEAPAKAPFVLVKLGLTLGQNGKFVEAEARFREALSINPTYLAALLSLGELLVNQTRYDKAELLAAKLLQHHGNDHRVLALVANVFTQLGRYQEAARLLAKLLHSSHDNVRATLALSIVYLKLQDYELARMTLQPLVSLHPETTALNLGMIAERELRIDEAITHYRYGLTILPEDPSLLFNLSQALLKTAQFEEGWHLFENRLRLPMFAHVTRHSSPRWNGENLQNCTLYIVIEQGFGDILQCLAYMPVLKDLGATLAYGMSASADFPGEIHGRDRSDN